MSQYKLSEGIISLSNSQNWDEAKLEWKLKEVFMSDEPDTCLCGHNPIKEICVLINKANGNETIVGNSCVKKFIGLPSDKIFQSVKRVKKDNSKALNIEAIKHAHERSWINDWEYKFSVDTTRKRSLSDKQIAVRKKINNKVLSRMKREK